MGIVAIVVTVKHMPPSLQFSRDALLSPCASEQTEARSGKPLAQVLQTPSGLWPVTRRSARVFPWRVGCGPGEMGRGRGVWFLPRPQLAVLPSSTQSPHPPFEGPWVGCLFSGGTAPGTGLAGTISAAMLTALIHSLISFTKSPWFWSRLLGVHSESLLPGGGTRHFPSLSFSSLVR